MNDWKTIAEIEAETSKLQYISPLDYARAIAITVFLEGLETEHKDEFRIICVHPYIAYNKLTCDEAFTLGLWASFCIKGVEYYVNVDKNPFFDAYFKKGVRISGGKIKSEYLTPMNGIIYAGVDIAINGDKTGNSLKAFILNFTENLKTALGIVQSRNEPMYVKDLPASDRVLKQTIYTN